MARKECDTSPHGWTLDTLEEFLSSKISALSNFTTAESRASKEAVAAALEAVKEQSNAAMQAAAKAIDKAELATERRFEGVNEFRQTLSDQARTFMNREEYAIGHRALEQKVDDLKARMDSGEGKSTGIGQSWGLIVGAVGIIYGVLGSIAFAVRFLH
jgi:hypothetical protein